MPEGHGRARPEASAPESERARGTRASAPGSEGAREQARPRDTGERTRKRARPGARAPEDPRDTGERARSAPGERARKRVHRMAIHIVSDPIMIVNGSRHYNIHHERHKDMTILSRARGTQRCDDSAMGHEVQKMIYVNMYSTPGWCSMGYLPYFLGGIHSLK